MLVIVIMLASFSLAALGISIWTLVYLRKAVVKEHEHVQKLFRVMWKLKDHLQAQIEVIERERADGYKKIRAELAKVVRSFRQFVRRETTVATTVQSARISRLTEDIGVIGDAFDKIGGLLGRRTQLSRHHPDRTGEQGDAPG